MKNGPAAFELPAETTQASYGNPLFGLPDGSVLAVLANPNPASSNEPDDSPWTEVAAMMNEKADPKAVRLTHALHLLMEPEATALFGSRARGNHRPDSDVNIMVVTTRPPPPPPRRQPTSEADLRTRRRGRDHQHNGSRIRGNRAVFEHVRNRCTSGQSNDQRRTSQLA